MRREETQKGAVLILVTLAAGLLFGMLGLAIDLGWMFFLKRSAQTAADSAAQAAAIEALAAVGQTARFECGETSACQNAQACPEIPITEPSGNLDYGCAYAARNGFRQNGQEGRQHVFLAADANSTPPAAPGVAADYWVTATVSQRVPATFSAVLGRVGGTSAANATAAVVESRVPGSLILLNREGDCLPMESGSEARCGVNLLVQANDNGGTYAVRADGGILLASAANGIGGDYAGENRGGGTVHSPYTYIRGAGDYLLGGSADWTNAPTTGKPDGPMFLDPMRGKGQPQAPKGLVDRPVDGGELVGGTAAAPLVLQPGNYYAVSGWPAKPTGDAIRLSGHIRFASGGTGFGKYVFFGGISNRRAGTVVTFDPGAYFFAGVKSQANGDPGVLFDIQKNMTLNDGTSGFEANTDPGELLVFTDLNYPGLQVPQALNGIAGELHHGTAGFSVGNTDASVVNLHGLNKNSAALPSEYENFAPVLMWQDQANSVVRYTPNGYLDTSCGNLAGCPNNSLRTARSAKLSFNASPNAHLYGVIYQPRGAWTEMGGGGSYMGPLQLISGAVSVQGNSRIRLLPIGTPLTRRVVALVR